MRRLCQISVTRRLPEGILPHTQTAQDGSQETEEMEKGGQHEKRKLTSMYVPIGEICQQNEEKTFPLRITFQKYSVWHDVQERNLTLLPGHGGASMVAYVGEMEK